MMTDEHSHDAHEPADAERTSSDAERSRRMHERTGEIELIISGALVFGLLQLPGRLDLWFDAASVRLDGELATAATMVWTYARLMVMALVVSFGLHLVTRAYWVGLIGLDSAFPGGVRWDRINYGPLAKDVYRKRLASLPLMARRADDFASSIFSFAFWIVLIFLLSIVLSAVMGAAMMVVQRVLLPQLPFIGLFFGSIMVVALVPMTAMGLDRLLEGRIDPEGRLARSVSGTVAAFFLLFGGPLFMPIQFTLFSNVSKRVMWPLYVGFIVLLTTMTMGSLVTRSGVLVLSASAALPERPGIRSVDVRYFEDRRPPGPADAPSIPSDVIAGPYVRLTVPWVPSRDVERLEALCPELSPLGRSGVVRSSTRKPPPDEAGMERSLGCLSSLSIVRLDGRVLSPEWDFVSAPGTGVTGLVTYLPTAPMEAGAHVLEIESVPTPRERTRAGEGEEPEIRRHYIRFRR